MTPRQVRSTLGLLLALPLAALIAGTLACLPVPLGDPEKSKVDPKLTGYWLAEGDRKQDDSEGILYVVREFDPRCYVVIGLTYKQKTPVEAMSQMVTKAWLTSLGGKVFLTASPIQFLSPKEASPIAYFVGAVDIKDDTLTVRWLKGEDEPLKSLKTTAEAETLIAASVARNELYHDAQTFTRVKPDDPRVRAVLKTFHLANDPK